ncbi:hypothetical protein DJ69_05285 [Halorubrum persicum]|uniref:Uncharacterized protein n=1 Tax=Halorubrum persicum TaxID=1383844 RepID=A0A2G1WKW2_9EURY|nr:hypothetical protein [Halorubrum persicum]PHQ39654.1 hypothetical protein DJ69_05285 [Halorubrum persicum]
MVRRIRGPLPAVALVLVLLLAGCSGLPATDRQESASEPTVENFSYPSGWSQDGIADLPVALETHEETVNNTSRRSRLSIIDEDSNRTTVRAVDTESGTASVRWSDTLFGSDVHSYYSAEGVFEYDRTTGELTRRLDENWTQDRVASHERLRLQRSLSELEANATETVTVEGTTAVRYNVTGIKDPLRVPAHNATGHVVVTERGYIAEFNITRGNDGFTRQTRHDVSEFGNATVTRPAWMPVE